MAADQGHIEWFRNSSPYVKAHRGRSFVVHLGGEALEAARLPGLAADLTLLDSLGVRLALVHGARPQVDAELARQGLATEWHEGLRITPPELMDLVVGVMGAVGARLQAALSKGVAGSPVQGRELLCLSGNLVRARPIGVRDGVDYQKTGVCRKVNKAAFWQQMEAGALMIVPPYGSSPSGEIFNLESAELAKELAVSIRADKLIYMTGAPGVLDAAGQVVSEIDLHGQPGLAAEAGLGRLLDLCRSACEGGVERCHLVSYQEDGALLQELFTRDGAGTQVVGQSYEQTRDACSEDVAGILALTLPLEAEGLLAPRSRELIEAEIDRYVVIERDGLVIGCAALHAFGDWGELACLAIHASYREGTRGERLLAAVRQRAQAAGLKQLFALTTQSADWFRERGFAEAPLDSLPEAKQRFYNAARNAKALVLPLDEVHK